MTTEQRNGFIREVAKYLIAGFLGGGVGGGLSGQITIRDLDRIDARVSVLERKQEEVALRQAAAIARRESEYKSILDQLAEIKEEMKALRGRR